MDMKLKNILMALPVCWLLSSCVMEEPVLPGQAAAGEGFAVNLCYEAYDLGAGGIASSSSKDSKESGHFPEPFSGRKTADYDRVEFAVLNEDGSRNRNLKGYYDRDLSSIRIEGLDEGSYRLLILGIKGDYVSDKAVISDINSISDIWLSFPQDMAAPLAAEYFYSSTPFEIVRRHGSSGYDLVAEIPVSVKQKRVVSRVDFTFRFRNAFTEAAVVSNIVTLSVPEYASAMTAGGDFSGKIPGREWTLDMSGNRAFHFLPSSSEMTGEAEILTKSYTGDIVKGRYRFAVPASTPNFLYEAVVDAVHPDDESGTLYVSEKLYEAGNHGKILQDDEPHEIYTDKTERNFNTSAPLQVSVDDSGRLKVRFYSPRGLSDVLIRARIPSEGDFFVDLAYFDYIPPFADFISGMPLTERAGFYRTDTGRIVEIGKKDSHELQGIEFSIESEDPFWSKLRKIEHGWNIRFDLFGGDPLQPDGGPQGNWMGIRPVHCREAVAFFLNFTYMIDMPEHEQILRENQDRLYGNGGVDDKVTPETVLAQMRQARTINVGLVYPGNGVVGLGGGSTFGAYQPGWISHYDSLYSCEIMFHELGHVMGYSHSSSFTYGPWAQELMNHFYVEHISEMPVDSPHYLDSASNQNLYR